MEQGTKWASGIGSGLVIVLIIQWILAVWWSQEPDLPDIHVRAAEMAATTQSTQVTGFVTTTALIEATRTLLEKNGGYLSNDVTPPSVLMDNMPNWEFGVLVQIRDLARYFRKDFSRSQSQSEEDKDLAEAEPLLNSPNDSWLLPSTESRYYEAITRLETYRKRLADPGQQHAQFYARADNLRRWLEDVEKRLGSLSQRLSASVGQMRIDTAMANSPGAQSATPRDAEIYDKTPWLQIDDVFYEARGACWALIFFMNAIEKDFGDVLKNKNAVVSLRQIIRELEGTQKSVWSPMVLNGTDFGLVANYSLVMASYVSRANAAVIDLRALLEQG
jgi:hypothetical protein